MDLNIFEYFAEYRKRAKRAGISKNDMDDICEFAQSMENYEECRDYLLVKIDDL